jgi:hypothetical protein
MASTESNISQLTATYTTAGTIFSTPSISENYVYTSDNVGFIYQLERENISNLINSYSTGSSIFGSSSVSEEYLYTGAQNGYLYQLNASNISNLIASYNTGGAIYSTPTVSNDYVYIGSNGNYFFQLNASNISQQIANYSLGSAVSYSSPVISNGYAYIPSSNLGVLYQLNASNISQEIANYTTMDKITTTPAVSADYIYFGSADTFFYQLNASNISQQIANYTATSSIAYSAPVLTNTFVYFADDSNLYQLNASNISQQIMNISSKPNTLAFSNGYLYSRDKINGYLYQLNASNISQQIANYSIGITGTHYASPVIYGNSVYVPSSTTLYQLNSSHFQTKAQVDYPIEGSTLTNPIFNINWTCSGDYDSYLANVTLDGSIIGYNMTSINGSSTQLLSEISAFNGTHIISVLCFNETSSGSISATFNMNLSAITVTQNSPINYFNTSNTSIFFNFMAVNDYSGNSSCFLLLDGSTASVCYQQFTNQSDSRDGTCSLNYSGNYNFSNLMNDGNFFTYQYPSTGTYQFNVSKPDTYSGTGKIILGIAEVCTGCQFQDATYHTYYIDIPTSCSSYGGNDIIYKIDGLGSGGHGSTMNLSCKSSTDWVLLYNKMTAFGYGYFISDLANLWDVNSISILTENSTNTSITGYTTEGSHNWSIFCNDSYGSTGQSPTRDFFISTTNPTIANLSPSYGTSTTSRDVTFSFTVTHPYFTNFNCSFYFDPSTSPNSTINQTNSSVVNDTLTIFSLTNISYGSYKWLIGCTNEVGNSINSSTTSLTIAQPSGGGGLPPEPEENETIEIEEIELKPEFIEDILEEYPDLGSIDFECKPTLQKTFPALGANLLDGLICNGQGLFSLYIKKTGSALNLATVSFIIVLVFALNTSDNLSKLLWAFIIGIFFLGANFILLSATALFLALGTGVESFAQALNNLLNT